MLLLLAMCTVKVIGDQVSVPLRGFLLLLRRQIIDYGDLKELVVSVPLRGFLLLLPDILRVAFGAQSHKFQSP